MCEAKLALETHLHIFRWPKGLWIIAAREARILMQREDCHPSMIAMFVGMLRRIDLNSTGV